jgi:hypothetical protein
MDSATFSWLLDQWLPSLALPADLSPEWYFAVNDIREAGDWCGYRTLQERGLPTDIFTVPDAEVVAHVIGEVDQVIKKFEGLPDGDLAAVQAAGAKLPYFLFFRNPPRSVGKLKFLRDMLMEGRWEPPLGGLTEKMRAAQRAAAPLFPQARFAAVGAPDAPAP